MDLSDFSVAMPAFFAVAAMPFTYNIAYGVLFSMLSYTLCMAVTRQKKAALSHDADPNGSLFDVLDSGRYFLTEWRVVLC